MCHWNIAWYSAFEIPALTGLILENKGMCEIFQKKEQKMLKRIKEGRKFGQKCTKFENVLKKAGDFVWLSHTINY